MIGVHLGDFLKLIELLILAEIQCIGGNISPILVLCWLVLGSLLGGFALAPHKRHCIDSRNPQVGTAGFSDVCHRQSYLC